MLRLNHKQARFVYDEISGYKKVSVPCTNFVYKCLCKKVFINQPSLDIFKRRIQSLSRALVSDFNIVASTEPTIYNEF